MQMEQGREEKKPTPQDKTHGEKEQHTTHGCSVSVCDREENKKCVLPWFWPVRAERDEQREEL